MMHLNNIPVPLLVAVASLCSPSSALPFPFLWRRTPVAEALAPAARPTYSVVPIDGSGGQGGDADTTLTVTVTAAPTTVVESSPPTTKTITVSGKPVTRTISIIDIEPTTEVVTTTLTATPTSTSHTITTSRSTVSTTSSSSAPSSSSEPGSSSEPSSPSTSATPSTTPAPSYSVTSSVYYPTTIWSWNVTVTPTLTTSVPASSWATGTSYDDGSWHTSYPTWSDSMARRFAKQW